MKKLIAISLIALTATCAFAHHHRPHHVILPPHVPHFISSCPSFYARLFDAGSAACVGACYYVQRMKMGVPVMVWVPGHWKVI